MGTYSANGDYVPSWAAAKAAADGIDLSGGIGQPTPYAEVDGGGGSQIARGIRAAFGSTKAGMYGLGASVADVIGANEQARRWYEQALAEQAAAEAAGPRVRSIRQIMEGDNYLADTRDYVAGKVGEFLPYMVLGGAAGFGGRSLGTVAGLRQGLTGAELAAKGARWGHLAGAASFQPSMAGSAAMEMYEEAPEMSPEERLIRSQGVGALEAGVGAYVPSKMLPGRVMSREAIPAGEFGLGQAIKRAATDTARGSLAGGAGVAAMDVVGQMHRGSYDPNYQFNPEQTGEAFAGGVAGMAPITAVHAGVAQGLDMADAGARRAAEIAMKDALPAMRTFGKQAYDAAPDNVKAILRGIQAGDIAAGEAFDAVEPYIKHMSKTGKAMFEGMKRSAARTENAVMGTLDGGGSAKEAAAAGITEIQDGANLQAAIVDQSIKAAKETLPSLSDTGREVASALTGGKVKNADEAMIAFSKIMEDPRSFIANDPSGITVDSLKEADSRAARGFNNYLKTLTAYLEHAGTPDTETTRHLRELVDRANGSDGLEPQEMYDVAKFGRIVAESKKLLGEFGPEHREQIANLDGGQFSKGGKDVFNHAVRDALTTAGLDKSIVVKVANRVNEATVRLDGATRLAKIMREEINKEYEARGMGQVLQDMQRDPEGYNRFWQNIAKQLKALKDERMPDIPDEGLRPSEAYQQHINDTLDSMFAALPDELRNAPGTKELLASPELQQQFKQGIADRLTEIANKGKGGSAARLHDSFENRFGELGTKALEDLVLGAHAEYGAGSKEAQRVTNALARRDSVQKARQDLAPLMRAKGDPKAMLEQMTSEYRAALAAATKEVEVPNGELSSFQKALYEARLKQKKETTAERSIGAFDELKEQWSDRIAPKNFERALEIVRRHDQDTRPDTNGKRGTSNAQRYAAEKIEDLNDNEARQLAAEQAGKESNDPDMSELDVQQANETGVDRKSTPTQFVGAGGIMEGSRAKSGLKSTDGEPAVHAPLSNFGAAERASSARGIHAISEIDAEKAEVFSKLGHKVADDAKISVADWAYEMVQEHGKDVHYWMDKALDALEAHDQNRRERLMKINSDEARRQVWFIDRRAEKIAALKADKEYRPGAQFFSDKEGSHYRYLRVEPADMANVKLNAKQLEYRYGMMEPTGDAKRLEDVTSTRRFVDYVARRMRMEQVKQLPEEAQALFNTQVYRDSMLPVNIKGEDSKNQLIGVDFAALVSDLFRRHQKGDLGGVMTEDYMKQLLGAVHTALSTILDAKGVTDDALGLQYRGMTDRRLRGFLIEGDKHAERMDVEGPHRHRTARAGTFVELDPNLVALRDQHNARVIRLRDLTGIMGIDAEKRFILNGKAFEGGKWREGTPALSSGEYAGFAKRFMQPTTGARSINGRSLDAPLASTDKRKSGAYDGDQPISNRGFGGEAQAVTEAAKEGIVRRGVSLGAKDYDVDMAKMVYGMLERNGIHELPFADVRAHFRGEWNKATPSTLLDMMAREAVMELKAQGYKVSEALSKQPFMETNEKAPRNLGDAQLHEAQKRIDAAMSKYEAVMRGESTYGKTEGARTKARHDLNEALEALKFVSGSGRGDIEGFGRQVSSTEQARTGENISNERNKYSDNDIQNVVIQQNVEEARTPRSGAQSREEAAAFDRAADNAFDDRKPGITQRVFRRQEERGSMKPARAAELAPKLYDRMLDAAKDDPALQDVIRRTFDMTVEDFEKELGARYKTASSAPGIAGEELPRPITSDAGPVRAGANPSASRVASENAARTASVGKDPEVAPLNKPTTAYEAPRIPAKVKFNAKMESKDVRTNADELEASAQRKQFENTMGEVVSETSRVITNRMREKEAERLAATEADAPKAEKPVVQAQAPAPKAEKPAARTMTPEEFANKTADGKLSIDGITRWLKNADDAALSEFNDLIRDSELPGHEQVRAIMSEGQYSKERLADAEMPSEWHARTQKQLQAEADRLVEGLNIKLTPDVPEGAAGWYKDGAALISTFARDPQSTNHHEIWHHVEKMLEGMGKEGQRILDTITRHVDTPMMREWLIKNFEKDADVLKQLDDPRERAAYTFQLFKKGGEIKMPLSDQTRSVFRKLWDFIKSGFGLFKNDAQKVADFMKYVDSGAFKRDAKNPEAVRRGMSDRMADNAKDAVMEAAKPLTAAIDKVLGHSYERVKATSINEYNAILTRIAGPSGKGGLKLQEHSAALRFANAFGDEYSKLDEAGKKNFENSAEYRKLLNSLDTYMNSAGMDRKDIQRILDRYDGFNQDAINARFDEFLTDVTNYGGVDAKDAAKIASHIADLGHYADMKEWRNFPLFEKRPDIRDKWMDKDVEARTARMIMLATKAAEFTRAFGQDGGELKKLLEAGDAKASTEQQQLMRDMINAYNGRLGVGKMSPAIKQLQAAMLTANNVRILPRGVFSQLLEPLQIGARRNSLEGSLGMLFKGIMDMPKSFDFIGETAQRSDWEKFAYGIGSAPSRIIRDTMSTLMNGQHMGGKIGWLNNKFFQYNFMEQWSRTMHVEATREAVEFLRDHHEMKDEMSQRFMEELGLEKGDVKFDKSGMPIIDGTERGRRVQNAILQFVEEAMAHPDAGSNPMWMNDPRFALLAQMKRFTFAHARYVLQRGVNEYMKGNGFVIAPALLAMPWMAASDALRDAVTGGEGFQGKGITDSLAHYYERAGHLTPGAQFISDTAQSLQFGKLPVDAISPTLDLADTVAKGVHEGKGMATMVDMVPGGSLLPGF